MPPVLVVLFWIWLVVSVVAFVVRRVRRSRADDVTGAPVAASIPDGTLADAPVTDARPQPEPSFFAGPTDLPDPSPEPVAVGAVPAPSAPPAPPPGFEPVVTPAAERRAPRSAPAAGIADALVGIRMPCDLVPLVMDRLVADRVTLSTTGYPAEVVGTALADEIERLGYVLRPLSDRELIATRGATELRLTITPPGADGLHVEHPTAREDSVVVVIAQS